MILISLFFTLFGYPSILRYQDKKTQVIHEKIPSSGIEAPAVTFCPRNRKTNNSWKKYKETSGHHNLSAACSQYKDDVETCIVTGTYNLYDFMRGVEKGFLSRQQISNDSYWEEEVASTGYGKCYTLNYPAIITTDYREDQLYFFLDKNVDYRIMIHEENYFELFIHQLIAPYVMIEIETLSSFNQQNKIILIELIELNVPQDPCEEDPEYNFRACIRENFTSQIGCRTKWDRWSNRRWPLCTTIEQYR